MVGKRQAVGKGVQRRSCVTLRAHLAFYFPSPSSRWRWGSPGSRLWRRWFVGSVLCKGREGCGRGRWRSWAAGPREASAEPTGNPGAGTLQSIWVRTRGPGLYILGRPVFRYSAFWGMTRRRKFFSAPWRGPRWPSTESTVMHGHQVTSSPCHPFWPNVCFSFLFPCSSGGSIILQ